MKFSHLHVHTQYSLLDGAASIKNLYKKAIADGMPALAISDHGNMYGVFEFVKEAYKHKNADGSLKVKPIVGCEFYITTDRTRKTFTKGDRDPRHHQILLAKNETGYKNLMKLTSLGFTEGLYSKYPRIDKELIHKYHEGLIATTCCIGALVPQTILKKGEKEAENEFKWWLNIFGKDFYIELQRHDIPEQEKINTVLLKFAKKYDVKIIATNDSHYVDQEDYNAHDILLCINTQQYKSTPSSANFGDEEGNSKNTRFAFPNDQFYLKTTDQMAKLFKDIPEAIDNTNEIVDKVDLLNLKRDILLPHFSIPPGFASQDDYLHDLTWSGAKKRYGIFTPEIEERLNFELGTIRKMGFAGYFLIVADFIKAGRDLGVFIGPGRGSAAGSAVAYCIGITNIDPIKYNLLFERFLNPERNTMPDIDTDFDDEGRQKVLDYVVEKYSKNQVAQVITYGTMAAKSSIADVARVMEMPLSESRALSKLLPDRLGVSLKRMLTAPLLKSDCTDGSSIEEKEDVKGDELNNVKLLREYYHGDELAGEVLRQAEKLEGSVRNVGVHASAIIIAPQNLMDLIPVATSKESPLLVTQITGDNIEEAGVIKMDFLGIKTLSVLKTCLALVKQNYGVDIVLDDLPLDDRKTFELFQAGDTNGVFQFESVGMQKSLRELKPDKIEDLIAMNALFRPGPIAYIPTFIARKHGREKVEYDIDEMEEYLAETYGVTVYQEQVMLLSQKLAGFSKGDADTLRKAMGKKNREILDKMKGKFISGAVERGYPQNKLEKIWTDWEAFAQYAFNKSHSTCYSYVAYQTAYLKANYPAEYMAASLNHAPSIDKITFFIEECKRMEIPVLGPDLNESFPGFTVNKKGQIRFGFVGIKGVGEAAIENIVAVRKTKGGFKDVFDFVKSVNLRSVSKKVMESLVKSGALDSFGFHRAQYFHQITGEPNTLEKIIKFGSIVQSHAETSANTLFGEVHMPEPDPPKIPDCDRWSLIEELNNEKDLIGMFLSAHPLDNYKFEFKNFNFTETKIFNQYLADIKTVPPPTFNIRLGGIIVDVIQRISKFGNAYTILHLEDFNGKSEIVINGDAQIAFKNYFEKNLRVMIEGNFRDKYGKGNYRFEINKICLLESAVAALSKELILEIDAVDIDSKLLSFFENNIRQNPGATRLTVHIKDDNDSLSIVLYKRAGLTMNTELVRYLEKNLHINVAVKSHNN